MEKLICKSEIYMITCEVTGKKYIGQVQCYGKRGKSFRRIGSETRWSSHVSDAKHRIEGRGARNLMNNINTYGAHNHKIKPLFICPSSQANYWETKFIREYNTQVPNGMNIMKGGKKAPLEEETKQKISEARKGKYGGDKNPMWGKHQSEETVQKIKDALKGKPLSEENKSNMSKAHMKNKAEGKLPPRRKHTDLPMYIYHVKSSNKEGYEIRNHPTLKQKQFTANTLSLEENLQRAIAYLNDLDNPNNQKEQKEFIEYKNLPRYMRHIRMETYEGFEVKGHPTLANKKWTSKQLSMEEKLKLAKKYLEESSETRSLSVN